MLIEALTADPTGAMSTYPPYRCVIRQYLTIQPAEVYNATHILSLWTNNPEQALSSGLQAVGYVSAMNLDPVGS